MFCATFLYWIGGKEHHSLIIHIYRHVSQWNVNFSKEISNPLYCLVHSVILQYSASVDESLTHFCCLESQETIPFAKNIAQPVVEQEVSTSPAQSVFEQVISPDSVPKAEYFMQRDCECERQPTICIAFCKCSSNGLEEYYDILITAYVMSGLET